MGPHVQSPQLIAAWRDLRPISSQDTARLQDPYDYELVAVINLFEPLTNTNGAARLALVFKLLELGSAQYHLLRYGDVEHTLPRPHQAIATLMQPRPDKLETQVAPAARQQSAPSK